MKAGFFNLQGNINRAKRSAFGAYPRTGEITTMLIARCLVLPKTQNGREARKESELKYSVAFLQKLKGFLGKKSGGAAMQRESEVGGKKENKFINTNQRP